MPNQSKATIFGIITVLLWSTVASAFKISLRYMDFIQLLLYSSLISVGCLGLIIVFQRKISLFPTYTRTQYFQALGLGILNPFLYYLLLFKAYDLLPAQEAQPLNYTWALTLTYLSVPLLRQKLTFKDVLAGVIGYFGVVVISTHGDITGLKFSDPLGVALALGSTVVWSLYWIYNKKSKMDPIIGLFLNFLMGLPLIFIICYLFSDIKVVSTYGLFGAVYVGLFEMGITFVFWLVALKLSVNSAKVSNLIFISPILSLIFIHYLAGEKILISTYFGLIIIMISLLIQKFNKQPHPKGTVLG